MAARQKKAARRRLFRAELPITWKRRERPERQKRQQQQGKQREPGPEPGQQQERGPGQAPAQASCRKRREQRQQPGRPARATSSYESSKRVELVFQSFAGLIRRFRQRETRIRPRETKGDALFVNSGLYAELGHSLGRAQCPSTAVSTLSLCLRRWAVKVRSR